MFKLSAANLITLLLFCVPNTLLSVGILVVMNNFVSGKTLFAGGYQGILFFSMVVASFFLNLLLQKKVVAYSNRLVYENELKMMESLLAISPSRLSALGSQRVYGAIEDMRMLVSLPGMTATAITLLLTLVICLGYFVVLSLPATLFVAGLIALIVFVYFSVSRKLSGRMQHLRQLNDRYFKLVDDVLKGFRELRLSARRRHNLVNKYLQPNRAEARDKETYVSDYLSFIGLLSQYGLYLIIGVVIFILPGLRLLNAEQVSAFVVILLFIRGPINALAGMQAFFTRASAANRRVRAFRKELEEDDRPPVHEEHSPVRKGGVTSLRFENIGFRYPGAPSTEAYALRNLNLTIRQGEVIFIIGGNGSGKSTFINILTGINAPAEGQVYLNGLPVTPDSQAYRDHIAAIYTENHLFSENLEDYSLANNEVYKSLLRVMELDKVVKDDDEASARRSFSKGQGKRMGLIFALLEQRPVLVLDEWAADQDPHFRKYFYEVLIRKLKREGKTIVAVTHDDAYFHHADRVVKFEYGKIVEDVRVRKAPARSLAESPGYQVAGNGHQ